MRVEEQDLGEGGDRLSHTSRMKVGWWRIANEIVSRAQELRTRKRTLTSHSDGEGLTIKEIGNQAIEFGLGWRGREDLYPFNWLDLAVQ